MGLVLDSFLVQKGPQKPGCFIPLFLGVPEPQIGAQTSPNPLKDPRKGLFGHFSLGSQRPEL